MKIRHDAKSLMLAIDIGTSSVRAALYDEKAELVPRTSVKRQYQFTTTGDGGSEIDADVLHAHVVDVIDAVLQKSSRLKGEIECVASCSFWHSLMGVDDRGRPTISWYGYIQAERRRR